MAYSDAPRPLRERIARAVRAAVIGYVAVASFPHAYSYYPLHPGLDVSWVYGLNQFVHAGFKFGRDVNFTYGPLGFLLFPANVGDHVPLAIAFRCAISALLVVSLALLSAPGRTMGFVVFALGSAVALGLGHIFEFHLLVLTALGALVALERRSLVGLATVSVLTGPLVLTKFSVGAGALPVVLAGAIGWCLWAKGSARSAAGLVLAHLGALLLSARLATGSAASAYLWLRASLEIASGYSAAMSTSAGRDDNLAIAICVVLVLTIAALYLRRRAAAAPLLLLTGTTFLAYKAGFVRGGDAHVTTFYGFATAMVAAAAIAADSAKELGVTIVSLAIITAIGLNGEWRRGYLNGSSFLEAASGRTGWGGIQRALSARELRRSLDEETASSLGPDLLPGELRRTIGAETISILPTELVYCLANGLNCVPLATLQAYNAYTPYLDFINAAQFQGARSPEFVLVHGLGTVDARHTVLDSSFTWRALLDRYRLVSLTPGLALLRKRTDPPAAELRPVSSDTVRFGSWFKVPIVPGRVFARIPFEMTAHGALAKLGYRIPEAFLDLQRRSGAIERRRIILDMARNGLLVQPFAPELEDMRRLFDAGEGDRVVAVRIFGPATRFYRDEAHVSWFAEEIPEESDGAVGAAATSQAATIP